MQNNILNFAEFLDDKESKTFDAPLNSSRKAKLSKDPKLIKEKIIKLKPKEAPVSEPSVDPKPVAPENQAPKEEPVQVETSKTEPANVQPEVQTPPAAEPTATTSNNDTIMQTFSNKGVSIIPIDNVYDATGTNYNRLRVSSQVVEKGSHANKVGLANVAVNTEVPNSQENLNNQPTLAPSDTTTPVTSNEMEVPAPTSETVEPSSSLQSFDFNQTVDLKDMDNEEPDETIEAETEESKEEVKSTGSKVNIDDYIGMSNEDNTAGDYSLDEMKKLQSENDSLKESIETQLGVLKGLKEKKEQLRKQKIVLIDDYRAQKAEYTQKLNKILEEINRATDEVEAEEAYIEEVKGKIV